MSELTRTLRRLAQAKLTALLPWPAVVELRDAYRAAAHDARVAKARRRNPTHDVRGRLVFLDAPEKPLPLLEVELWDRDPLKSDDWLGADLTGPDGRFAITYDPADAGGFDDPDLELRVYDRVHGERALVAITPIAKDVVDVHLDLGDRPVAFYPYAPGVPVPLAHAPPTRGLDGLPERYTVGRQVAMAEAASAILPVRVKHLAAGTVDLQTVQRDHARRLGLPGRPRRDPTAVLLDAAQRGTAPFSRDPDGLLHVVLSFHRWALDGTHERPEVDAAFRLDAGALCPVSITLTPRPDPAPAGALGPPVTHRPADPGWADAVHAFTCAAFVRAEAVDHLGRAHANVAQIALAACRNLRLNPVRSLLGPHLREVLVTVAELFPGLLAGEALLTRASALTPDGALSAVADGLSVDWWGWRPRTPVCAGHAYAHAAHAYWDLLAPVVDAFLAEHLEGIARHWHELVALGEDLADHSPPLRPTTPPAGQTWACTHELPRHDAPRRLAGGVPRVMSPLPPTPDAEGLAALAALCRFTLFHATFFHTWVHDGVDVLAPDAPHHATDGTPAELAEHVSLVLLRQRTRHGLVLANEEGDIAPMLIEAVHAAADALAVQGLDVAHLRSRVNV